jgi:hypothetical protein
VNRWVAWLSLGGALALGGCAVGEGEGRITSDRLYVEDCWNGPFDLRPTFFGANPYREESLFIRVQRGDNIEEESDGLAIVVNDLQDLRQQIEQPIPVGMPPGVSPPGVPIVANPNPPKVSLTLYLHNTCHSENATVYSIDGNITFHSLFSGDPNETNAEDRLTDAEFTATFADPRQLATAEGDTEPFKSQVDGYFRFYFQRGQPAQPFQ